MTEEKMMILRPYKFGDTDHRYGAWRITADCGHESWIGSAGSQFAQHHHALTVCTNCMPGEPLEVHVAPGTREELAARIGPAAADQAIAAVMDHGRRGTVKQFLQ